MLSDVKQELIEIDLPSEDHPTVLLLGVTKIPTSPIPQPRRPCSLPLTTNYSQNPTNTTTTTIKHNSLLINNNSSSSNNQLIENNCCYNEKCTTTTTTPTTITNDNNLINNTNELNNIGLIIMDRSVDSIGTCSLDVDASANLSDWSEISSTGTLHSASIKTPTPTTTPTTTTIITPATTTTAEQHLPSYLSLACTVSGYLSTTNYDPIRLSKSRDASPHRLDYDNLKNISTTIQQHQNNLLSPPNLVPLPTIVNTNRLKMNDQTITTQHYHHQEFYHSTKTTMTSYTTSSNICKENQQFNQTTINTSSSMSANNKDTIDACFNGENGLNHRNTSLLNGNSKCTSDTSIIHNNNKSSTSNETKSFIQQRVERLYGPGALAQGFFVTTKKQQKFLNNSITTTTTENDENYHSSTSNKEKLETEEIIVNNNKENLLNKTKIIEPMMKQSTSSPTLPVLRHLRPEFRAQLPIINNRNKIIINENSMQKSNTIPIINDEIKLNGHLLNQTNNEIVINENNGNSIIENGDKIINDIKDGHYFLKILDYETKRLLKLADNIENELIINQELSEEIIGKIRSAAGKARLLVSQKMQQFKGLCTNNITQVEGEAFPTTNEDLQGFWDMVMLQVDQVDALFKEIDQLKANNWEEIKLSDVTDNKNNLNGTTTVNKPRKIVTSRPKSAVNEEIRKQREAQRKKLIEERRKAMKNKTTNNEQNIEIFVPESS